MKLQHSPFFADSCIVDHCDQQTVEWFAARCGVLTASKASCLVTPKGKLVTGKGRQTYLNEIIGERIARTVIVEGWSSSHTARGNELEPKAREWYYDQTKVDAKEFGFIYADETKRAGCSPDGIAEDIGVEIKCRSRKHHVGWLVSHQIPPADYCQMQFSMWVTGLAYWHYVNYTSEQTLKSDLVSLTRDENMMDAFSEATEAAYIDIEEAVAKLSIGDVLAWPPEAGSVTVQMPMIDELDMEGLE